MANVSRRLRTGLAAVAVTGAVGGGLWFATSAGASSVPAADPSGSGTTAAAPQGAPKGPLADVLAKLVANNTITQAQADAISAELAKSMPPKGPHGPAGPGGGGKGGPGMGGRPGDGLRGGGLDAVAKALGMTTDELRTALQGGKTIAAVAADKKVSVDTVVAAVVDAEKARLDQAVKDGKLTQAQADQALANAKQRATELVNGTVPGKGGPMGPGPRGPRRGPGTSTPSTTTA